jgi:DNA-3-methyladenine glycosylase
MIRLLKQTMLKLKKILTPDFYRRDDVVLIAKELLGKVLFSSISGQITGGIITETEAYRGVHDRACHAYGGRRTPRTEVMYAAGGVAYVYLCYGIHHLLNVVTADKDVPHAVLIRSLKPYHGIDVMQKRRQGKKPLCKGPGNVTQALGITTAHNGVVLTSDLLWIEDHGIFFDKIETTARIGIDYAGEDAHLPYRFVAF